MIELTPQQRGCVDKCKEILKRYMLLYLAAEVRCGKTLMSMTVARELGYKRILFLTKLKAIGSIEDDLRKSEYQFEKFKILNYEQMLTPNAPKPEYDLVILDEASVLAKYPKPGKITQKVKEICKGRAVLLMSGTPTAESPSQIFHQLWVSDKSPFSVHANFYKWFKEYGIPKKLWVNGFQINSYKLADETKIKEVTKHYMVTFSQKEAGFESFVEEHVFNVAIDERMYRLMRVLKKDKVYEMKNGCTILADTPVKLQSSFHQISSGTIIALRGEEKEAHVLDESKVWFIKTKFAGQKIAIYYKFIAEGELLRKHFPNHTDDPDEFNKSHNKEFICQIVSGRMGVNLSTADWLVMYNIDFSATSYFQVRARMQVRDRKKASKLAWIFSENGIEKYVYKAVTKKLDFTNDYFKAAVKEMQNQQLEIHAGK